ncbi:MAG: glycerophosphodiester phosphodiesterase [Simkaniaceae bacterium]|nr:glycerophosphodiester phosphodiesterase [Simkaniaceae bacterium]
MKILVIAHRTSKGHFPENSLYGLERCIALGFSHIDVDAVLTLDKILVVNHNLYINRKRISDQTQAQTKLPSLKEFLALLKLHPQVTLNIEMKTPDQGPHLKMLLDELDCHTQVIAQSFHLKALDALSNVTKALCCTKPNRLFAATAAKHGCNILCPNHRYVTKALVRSARRHHLKLFPWTVNTPESAERLLRLGVDGFFSDFFLPSTITKEAEKFSLDFRKCNHLSLTSIP